MAALDPLDAPHVEIDSLDAPHVEVEGGLRRRVARGTAINAAFDVGLGALSFLKGFIVAALITATEFGVWGLLVISLGTLLWLARVGLDDKYVQQEDEDQEKAFQLAFTLQTLLCWVFAGLILLVMPLFALAYDNWDVLLPAYVLALSLPAAALQTPIWAYYRRMEYGRQRLLLSFDPVVSFAVTIALAVGGLGYWSLVIGSVAGSWAAAAAAIRASPYPLKFRYEKGTLSEYATFSWPLLVGSGSGVLVAQLPILIAQRELGTAAIGAITLAGSMAVYAQRVDEIVTSSIYPAICRVRDRLDLLLESFVKSNRLALLWSLPLGVGVALFADDLVAHVIGENWAFAIGVTQLFALSAGLNQVFFNWSAFMRALGTTKPVAVSGFVMLIAVGALVVPLIFLAGTTGYGAGMLGATVVLIYVRFHYMRKLFPARVMLLNVARAMVPTAAAAATILLIRIATGGGPRDAVASATELGIFLSVVAIATFVIERDLLREFRQYLRPTEATAPGAVGGASAS
jgi:O-antigen/teichoic acid export membrane protein